MTKRLVVLACILTFISIAAAGPRFGRWHHEVSTITSSSARADTALLRLLGADGGGLNSATPICTAATNQALKIGNFFCLNGDTTSSIAATPGSLDAQNSPTTAQAAICPNGSDCSAVDRISVNGTNQYYTTHVGFTTSQTDWFMCAVIETSKTSGGQGFIGKWSAGTDSAFLWANGAGVQLSVGTTAGQSDVTGTGITLATGVRYMFCGSYHFVADTTSVGKFYVNGTLINTVSNMHGPTRASATAKFGIGSNQGGTLPLQGKIYGAIYSEMLPTDTQIKTFSDTVMGRLTGWHGEAVTVTRASTGTCINYDGGVSNSVYTDQPCVAGGRLLFSNGQVEKTPNPVDAGDKACSSVTVDMSDHWNQTGNSTLEQWGTYHAANSASFYVDSNRSLGLNTYQWDGGNTITLSDAWAVWTGPRNLGFCVASDAGIQLYMDGAQMPAYTFTGPDAGVNWSPAPANIAFGNGASASTDPFSPSGYVNNICVSNDPLDCMVSPPARLGGATKRIACIGDSITQGYLVNPSYPDKVERIMSDINKKTWNFGVGGTTAAQMLARWRSFVRGHGYTHLTLMGGTNDVRNGTTAATAWASLQTIADEAISDGMTVTLLTIPPFKGAVGGTGSNLTEGDTLNSNILTYCTNHSLTCVDVHTLLKDSVDAQKMALTYDSGDHLHPNQTGSDLIGTNLEAVVDP
jgi:lysophospholipase L1-like esterase